MPKINEKSRTDSTSGGGTATKEKARPRSKAKRVEYAAREYFDAFIARDPERMGAHWHEEGVEDLVALGKVLRGPAEVRQFFKELFAAMPDVETTVDRIIADTSSAAVQWRLTATFNGSPFQGIVATGRRIDMRGTDVLEIDPEDGKIRRNTVFYDGMAFARGAGLLPAQDSGTERAMFGAFNAVTKLRSRVRSRAR